MKKKIILITLFLALLLPIKTAFGAVTYSRSPAGFTINNPVSFDVGFDSYNADTGCSALDGYYGLYILRDGPFSDQRPSVFIASTTNNYVFDEFVEEDEDEPTSLALGNDYVIVAIACADTATPVWGDVSIGEYLEYYEEGGIIFEVVEAGGSAGVFFTLPTSTLTDLQAHIGDLVTDTSLLWIIAIALPLGFWMISKVIRIVKSKAK